ncbi:MAG: NhaP-type Na+/H+ or K+/H+ antiporter [Verrucomicrobiales bacterium]|jgi:NhaP-type Na+/H+ or K+/H+ antiporter
MHDPAVYLASVLGLGMVAQWIAWRLKLPSILLLLGFGFAAGQFFGPPDDYLKPELLFPFVSLCVAVILFEGGLTLRFSELRESGTAVLRLCSIGALVAWVLITLAAIFILGFDWRLAILVGAVLIVTGPTVIAPLLRQIKPSKRVGATAKWEGIVIDPVGAVIAVLVLQGLIAGSMQAAVGAAAIGIVKTLLIGGILGGVAAWILVQLLKRHLIPDYLESAMLLAVSVGIFVASNSLQHESGLLAVTVLGIALANQKSVCVRHVIEFKENLRVLLISVLFVLLSGRIVWAEMAQLGWGAIAFLAALIFVVRPLSVWASTIGTPLTVKERWFLCFLAPRGIVAAAVASVFTIELLHAAEENLLPADLEQQASLLGPLTFVVIVGTVAFYGLAAAPIARWLGLAQAKPQGILFVGADAWVRAVAKAVHSNGIPVLLVDTNPQQISRARMEGLPTALGNVLSETVGERLDLSGIGRLFAVTPNDEVNSLAAIEYAHVFSRSEIYQLAPWSNRSTAKADSPQHLRGRSLFSSEPTHATLRYLFHNGAVVKETNLTEQFTIEDFSNLYGDSAVILFAIDADGDLTVCGPDTAASLGAGQKVLALVQPPAEDKPATS